MWRGRTLGRLEMFFQTCCSPLCGGCSTPPAPLITLRLYSSQLRAASLDPCLSLLEVNGDREVATGAIEPIHHQSTLLWAYLGLASWGGTQLSGLSCTPHSRGLRKARAVSPHVAHARMPTRSPSAWELMFNLTHVCSNHEAPLAFLLPARQMKDRAQVLAADPLRSSLTPVLVLFPASLHLLLPQ